MAFKLSLLLFMNSTIDMVQSLQGLSYKPCSIVLPKFFRFGLFFLVLGHVRHYRQNSLLPCCDDIKVCLSYIIIHLINSLYNFSIHD